MVKLVMLGGGVHDELLAQFFDVRLLETAVGERSSYRIDVVHVVGQRGDVFFVGLDQLSLKKYKYQC